MSPDDEVSIRSPANAREKAAIATERSSSRLQCFNPLPRKREGESSQRSEPSAVFWFQSAPPQTRGRKGRTPGAVHGLTSFNPLPRKREGESPWTAPVTRSAHWFQSAPPQTRGRKPAIGADQKLPTRVSIRSPANAREKGCMREHDASARHVSIRSPANAREKGRSAR